MPQTITVTSISMNPDGYPSFTADIDWDGMILGKAKGEGIKLAPIDLQDAMNAFMPLVIEYSKLGDTWKDECGLDSIIESVTFGEDKIKLVAQLYTNIKADSHVQKVDRKSTRLNSSHPSRSRMPSSA